MECKQAKKRISQYLDDELALDEKEAFALHIRNCAACRKELEESQAISKMFSNAEKFSAPYGFATRVLANLQEMEQERPGGLHALRFLFLRTAQVGLAVAVIAIGTISGTLLLEQERPANTQAAIQESFSLGLFQATPPGSIGSIYLAYVEGQGE